MDAIKLLSDLIAINSVFPNEKKACEYVEKVLAKNGFKVTRQEISKNRWNVLGERGGEGKPLLFYGHLDTVPVYGQWDSDPFKLCEKDGKLYGRGTCDMKGGVAAILKACETKTSRRMKVAFCVDEENISEGAHALVKTRFLDDVEGVVTTELSGVQDESVGTRTITLGRRGRCVYEISVPGKSAHAALISQGVSAISEAAKLTLELERMNGKFKPHRILPEPSQFVRKFCVENSSLSLPENAVIELDRHLVTPETPESVLKEIAKFIDSLYATGKFKEIGGKRIAVKIKSRKTPYAMPYVTPKNHPLTLRLAAAVKTAMGRQALYNYGDSVADENVFAGAGLPVVAMGAIGGNEHSANEWVSKKSYLELIEVLEKFIL